VEEIERQWRSAGLSKEHAGFLASLEQAIEQGAEERLNDVLLKVTGYPPTTFVDYAEASKSNWAA
jgi:hypothetical protein